VWQPLPARENVEVTMPPGSPFRCIVTSLDVESEADDFKHKLERWTMRRDLLCSSDGWRSWIEHRYSEGVQPDGKREVSAPAPILLRHRSGTDILESYVVVRSDKERRQATTGPPRIVEGRAGVD
jgi:hypothetical protein